MHQKPKVQFARHTCHLISILTFSSQMFLHLISFYSRRASDRLKLWVGGAGMIYVLHIYKGLGLLHRQRHQRICRSGQVSTRGQGPQITALRPPPCSLDCPPIPQQCGNWEHFPPNECSRAATARAILSQHSCTDPAFSQVCHRLHLHQ